MDMNEQKYITICDKNRENIKKRWQKKGEEKCGQIQTNTNEYDAIPPNTKNTDTDIDTETDIDKKKKTESAKEIKSGRRKESIAKGIPFEKSKYFKGEEPTMLPDGFLALAIKKGFSGERTLQEFQKFTSHWLGKTGKTALKSERGWKMAFCITWLLNAKSYQADRLYGPRVNNNPYPTQEEKDAFLGRKNR